MRLDRFFTTLGVASRREISDAVSRGRVTVNGRTVKSASVHVDEENDVITLDGREIKYRKFFYLMLNKPAGYVSSTEDAGDTVMKLLPAEYERAGGFPCGRLDRDTVGLLLITNDGDTAHRLLSPRRHVAKKYRFECSEPLTDEMIKKLEHGVDLGDFVTSPATLEMSSPTSGVIGITEGKFHQIKRMLAEVGSGITFLERIKFGPLTLDDDLSRGEFRELTADEISLLIS